MSSAVQLAHSAPLAQSSAALARSRRLPLCRAQLAAFCRPGALPGRGPGRGEEPIVFVHGTPSWSFEYRHLIRGLCTSRRCIAFDHLGFGLSERPAAFGYRPEDHARVFAEFVAALGLERFTLVVHDFGGPIALPFAAAHPERIARLVVMNSFMWPIEDPKLAQQARFAGSAARAAACIAI